eukprot:TRINITY_DN48721_c0_g1_i1.p1 TRINITY_DN48721_c0_g1~~TRINITY_DN48721_c0_g1_i1.p1  ORF type:complete len:133 (+),score=31.14 TRINITY_DN48721_c0_g1_i1:32-400(+)
MLRACRGLLGYSRVVLKEGDGKTFARPGDTAKVYYELYKLTGGVRERVFKAHSVGRLLVGKDQNLKAIDKALLEMSKGEETLITCSSEYAYGEQGVAPLIPPQTDMEIKLTLRDVYAFEGEM